MCHIVNNTKSCQCRPGITDGVVHNMVVDYYAEHGVKPTVGQIAQLLKVRFGPAPLDCSACIIGKLHKQIDRAMAAIIAAQDNEIAAIAAE